MAYITPEEVRAIMDNCTLEDSKIDPYILSAHLLVTDVLGDSSLSTNRLTDIEKWLTAHLIASTQIRMATREKVGNAEVEYADKFGEGLNSTPYGQMVLLLDKTGVFAGIGKRVASIYAVKSFTANT